MAILALCLLLSPGDVTLTLHATPLSAETWLVAGAVDRLPIFGSAVAMATGTALSLTAQRPGTIAFGGLPILDTFTLVVTLDGDHGAGWLQADRRSAVPIIVTRC